MCILIVLFPLGFVLKLLTSILCFVVISMPGCMAGVDIIVFRNGGFLLNFTIKSTSGCL